MGDNDGGEGTSPIINPNANPKTEPNLNIGSEIFTQVEPIEEDVVSLVKLFVANWCDGYNPNELFEATRNYYNKNNQKST